jgi:hypothetical protein
MPEFNSRWVGWALTAFDTSNVIKADQFPSWHGQFVESKGVGTILKAALNMRSLDTIREWGEKLKRQHRPADLMALPDFMLPKAMTPARPVVMGQLPSLVNGRFAVANQVPQQDRVTWTKLPQ